MKDILLYGGIAIGGYLLFKVIGNELSTLTGTVQAIPSSVSTTTGTQPAGNITVPAGYIDSTLKAKLLATAQNHYPYSALLVQHNGTMQFGMWMQVYLLVTGHSTTVAPHDIYQGGDAYTALMSVDDFAAEINNTLSPMAFSQSLAGLALGRLTYSRRFGL